MCQNIVKNENKKGILFFSDIKLHESIAGTIILTTSKMFNDII